MQTESKLDMNQFKSLYFKYLDTYKKHFQHTEKTEENNRNWINARNESHNNAMALRSLLQDYFAILENKQKRETEYKLVCAVMKEYEKEYAEKNNLNLSDVNNMGNMLRDLFSAFCGIEPLTVDFISSLIGFHSKKFGQ